MTKTFSTKLDEKVLHILDAFCRQHHLKKAGLLEELIREGIRQRRETLELAQSIQRGLEQEKEGQLHSSEEVENRVFGKKRAG